LINASKMQETKVYKIFFEQFNLYDAASPSRFRREGIAA
jgi:hypothetical protein